MYGVKKSEIWRKKTVINVGEGREIGEGANGEIQKENNMEKEGVKSGGGKCRSERRNSGRRRRRSTTATTIRE